VLVLAFLLGLASRSWAQVAVMAVPAFLVSFVPSALVAVAMARQALPIPRQPDPASDQLDRRAAGGVAVAYGMAGFLVLTLLQG
jgi:hypothetical protein